MLTAYCRRIALAPHSGRFHAANGRWPIAALAVVSGLLLAGCSAPSSQTSSLFGGLLDPPSEAPAPVAAAPPAGPPPRPAKAACTNAAACKVALKSMIESPDRGWIGQRQSPSGYADGTRLFAYRALRKQLTCNELALALDELHGAAKSMSGPAPDMTPDQLARTRSLAAQVEAELNTERSGRCRSDARRT